MIVDPWLQQRSLKTHQRRNECNHPKYFKIGQWKDFAQIALFYFFPWPSGHPTPAQDEARPFWSALQFAPKTASRTSLSHHLWNPPMWKPVEPFNGAVKPGGTPRNLCGTNQSRPKTPSDSLWWETAPNHQTSIGWPLIVWPLPLCLIVNAVWF